MHTYLVYCYSIHILRVRLEKRKSAVTSRISSKLMLRIYLQAASLVFRSRVCIVVPGYNLHSAVCSLRGLGHVCRMRPAWTRGHGRQPFTSPTYDDLNYLDRQL